MAGSQNFFSTLRMLVEECRDALGPTGEVTDPLEYRFEVMVGERRFAFQGLPQEHKVLVGEESGSRGVVWLEELRYDEVTGGWGTPSQSAWDFVAGLSDLPPMAEPAAPMEMADETQGRQTTRGVRGVSRLMTGAAYVGAAWLSLRSMARRADRPRLGSRLRRRSRGAGRPST